MTPRRIAELREMFDKYKWYTTYELASVLNIHPDTLNTWRKACGVSTGKKCISKKPRKQRKEITAVPKDIWDNKEWFETMYSQGYGIPTIARMIGRSPPIVHKKFRQFGIPKRPYEEATATKNQCCNKQWLEDHYIKAKMTQNECAALAGVTDQTICKWLSKFQIPIRDRQEALAKRWMKNI